MKILSFISKKLDEKIILPEILKQYELIEGDIHKFNSDWYIYAYKNFKDIETYLILIFLIVKDFKFYINNGIILNYDNFYKDKNLEIENFKIIEISKYLRIPKETVRRKIFELENKGVIKKKNKNIFIDRSSYLISKPVESLKNISKIISKLSIALKEEKKINKSFSKEEIQTLIKQKFTFTWSFFADFIFIFYAQIYRNFRDFEALCIFYLISYNDIFSKNKLGLNTMSISEITGIPRPTVIRKLQILLKKQLIKIDDKKQYYTNNEKEKINELQSHSKIEVSKLIFKILNYISIN